MSNDLVTATEENDRLNSLKTLAMRLAQEIDYCDNPRDLAPLARQYRETLKAISELEITTDESIEDILNGTEAVR